MLKHLARMALFVAFVLVLTLAKELVIVVMSITRVDFYIPIYWLPHAPYLVLAVLVFPIVGWLFAKIFRSRTVALSLICGLLFLAGPLAYLWDGELFLILANIALALSFVFWVAIFVRLGARVSRE
jgi:hypothetical protein